MTSSSGLVGCLVRGGLMGFLLCRWLMVSSSFANDANNVHLLQIDMKVSVSRFSKTQKRYPDGKQT